MRSSNYPTHKSDADFDPAHSKFFRADGFSLIELVIVLAILSITALVAMPSIAPNHAMDVDVATGQISAALVFARDESIRTGVRHGVELDTTDRRLKVFRAPVGTTRVYNVMHPLTRGIYDVSLLRGARSEALTVTPTATWTGSCSASDDIGFDAWGLPRCATDWNARLATSVISVAMLGEKSLIDVQTETGRVVVR